MVQKVGSSILLIRPMKRDRVCGLFFVIILIYYNCYAIIYRLDFLVDAYLRKRKKMMATAVTEIDTTAVPCTECDGRGYRFVEQKMDRATVEMRSAFSFRGEAIAGRRHVVHEQCEKCKGTGKKRPRHP